MANNNRYRQSPTLSGWARIFLCLGGMVLGAGGTYLLSPEMSANDMGISLAGGHRPALIADHARRLPIARSVEPGSGSSRPAAMPQAAPTDRDKRGDSVIGASAATGASSVPSSQLSKLFELAIRQITEGRLDSPTGDNALETYRQVVALSPGEKATTELGTTLSVSLWRLANNAKEAELWDESLRYFARLRELPPVPLGEIFRHPAALTAPAGAAAPPVSPAAVSESERSEVDTFSMERGDELLRQRDVVGARHFYQRAALGGDAGAATALARTYDPSFLAAKGIRATLGDPAAAEHWYEAAIERGDATAAAPLERLRSSREIRLR